MGKWSAVRSLRSRRAETIIEVTFALFGITVILFSMRGMTDSALTVGGKSKLQAQAINLAEGGLDLVQTQINTNKRRFADPACWDTLETSDVCDSSSNSMAETGETKYYALFSDLVDSTPNLIGPLTNATNEFSDSIILSRLPNTYSIYTKYLAPGEIKPILSGPGNGAVLSPYSRLITIRGISTDVNGDTILEEGLRVTSTVKWPYKNEVKTHQVSTTFFNNED